ncbi:hypothetical protein [Pyrobaculum aerophilum]|uniref:hypothetical protein n=1 Tax=Pyrobaculum aerophilum TaxID=13773 RepID=UPI0015F25F97|nr:hypothetical protein [Pyrobaculum aerophilum]
MEIPQEISNYLAVERDQWDVEHIICRKCGKKFFTLKDAALHIYHIHGVKIAHKYAET